MSQFPSWPSDPDDERRRQQDPGSQRGDPFGRDDPYRRDARRSDEIRHRDEGELIDEHRHDEPRHDESLGEPEPTGEPPAEFDPARVKEFQQQLVLQQNFASGLLAGLAAAIFGAAVWGGISVATGFRLGLIALAVGWLVGVAVRWLGQGVSRRFGVAAALLALFGCALGNLLSVCGLIALQENIPFLTLLASLTPRAIVDIFVATFRPLDVLFYAFAIGAAYQTAFRRVTEAELAALLKQPAGHHQQPVDSGPWNRPH